MNPWVLVSGDFTPLGGMDYANHALARYLAARGTEVHIVAHRVWPDVAEQPGVVVHQVSRPLGKDMLGALPLARTGERVAAKLDAAGGRVVVNGGNCEWGDLNWVHYVHAAYEPQAKGSLFNRYKTRFHHNRALRGERRIVPSARAVVCNSERTKRDLVERLGVDADRAHVIYYGIDASRFRMLSDAERAEARERLRWPNDRPVVAFVGALGDRRKGFDSLFRAWKALMSDPRWDADLAVIGAGAELPEWSRRAESEGMASRIRFLGFRKDVPDILAACDAMVHPARYEAYGLGVQEALSCGIPVLVSANAGVAERYPEELAELLIEDVEDAGSLAERLRHWRANLESVRARVRPLAETIRANGWDAMAARIVELAGESAE